MLCNLMRSIGENSIGYQLEQIMVVNGKSYVESVNEGLGRSNGEYIIVLNDDVVIEDKEWLKKLCIPNCISAWQLGTFHTTGESVPDAACFAMHRDVFNRLGLMDLRYKDGINFEDTDYFFTAKEKGIPFVDAQVRMKHLGNVTEQTYFKDVKWGKTYHNEAIFNQKWQPLKRT